LHHMRSCSTVQSEILISEACFEMLKKDAA